jgi:hypothetical protein
MSRKKKVEMLFAHLKRILRLGRLRLRRPSGAKDEFLLAAAAQICGNWRSASLFRRRFSAHEATRPSFASLTGAAGAHRSRHTRGFFNEICRKRPDAGSGLAPTA